MTLLRSAPEPSPLLDLPVLAQPFPSPRALAIRKFVLAAAVSLPLFGITDYLVAQRFQPGSLIVRLVWSLALVVFGLSIPRLTRRQYSVMIAAQTSIGGICTVLIAALAGGMDSPLLAWTFALPLAIAVFIQDEIWGVTAGAASTLAAGLLALGYYRAGLEALTVWAFLYLASAGIAIYASVSYRKIQALDRQQERARLEAVEQLALSERRRAQSERLALVGQLASGVAHEINNPLAAAMMSISMIGADSSLGDAHHRRLELAQSSLERVSQIVTDLRTYGRDGPEESEISDPRPGIEDALRMSELRIRKVGRLERDVASPLPRVRVNQRQLSQVLLNLLVNAADACEERAQPGEALISLAARGVDGALEISVEDNGPGIPAALRPRLFQAFVTTKPSERGTGLGLALAREYVERMGGTLVGDNRPEGGARFVVRLPITIG